ncbi:MAG: hypothetical protein HUJ31_16360, partial [Pseudomonadales bacterium]|nr:hypothetical protein [Pseudomonadales bacterium]
MKIPERLKRLKLPVAVIVAVALCAGLVWGLQTRVERQPGYVSVRGDITTGQRRQVLEQLS